MTNAEIVDMVEDAVNEIFEPCLNLSDIEKNGRNLVHGNINFGNMITDDWCTDYNADTITLPATYFSWGCQMGWGAPAVSYSFDPPSCGCADTDTESDGNS